MSWAWAVMGQAMQDVVWALGASIIPNIEGLSGQLGSTLVYTQDAGTGGLIVVVKRDRQEKETESERKREEKGGGEVILVPYVKVLVWHIRLETGQALLSIGSWTTQQTTHRLNSMIA